MKIHFFTFIIFIPNLLFGQSENNIIDRSKYSHIVLENCLGQSRNLFKDKDGCLGVKEKEVIDVLEQTSFEIISNNKNKNNYSSKIKSFKKKVLLKDPKYLFLNYRRVNINFKDYRTTIKIKNSDNKEIFSKSYSNKSLREELSILF
tara:strand:- start:2389 stop:2829 length:441 start_codon:yes stop_codon:yes gene_type:complete